MPRCRGKYSEYTLFVHTEAIGEVYNNLIHEIKSVGNPNCLRVLNRYSHSTLSKAFSASREITASSSPGGEFVYIILYSRRRLLNGLRPRINPE